MPRVGHHFWCTLLEYIIRSCTLIAVMKIAAYFYTKYLYSHLYVDSSSHVAVYMSQTETTLNNGYLGSRNDEERSKMRYVV